MSTQKEQKEMQDRQMNIDAKAAAKKKQAPSASYTLKSFGNNNGKLLELGLINQETYDTLEKIKGEAVKKWMETQF